MLQTYRHTDPLTKLVLEEMRLENFLFTYQGEEGTKEKGGDRGEGRGAIV